MIMVKPWKIMSDERLFSSAPFNVIKRKLRKPDEGKIFDSYIIDAPEWVNIIGVTDKDEILLIEQFRFGSNTIELEIPGGVIEKGENPVDGARREFEEETGFSSDEFIEIGCVNANPAIMNNKCYTFLAKNIYKKGAQSLDPDEIIDYKLIKYSEVREKLKKGKITNAYVVAAFLWYSFCR